MKIKLDENMPMGLVAALERFGHQVETVPAEGLAGHDDHDVWNAVQHEKRLLITQDLDFSDVRRFSPGTHYGVMVVGLKTPGRLSLLQKVQEIFECENTGGWHGCFILLTDRKLRIHRGENPDHSG